MKEVSIVGLDLAKRVFQAHGTSVDGGVVFRRKLSARASLGLLYSPAEVHRCNGSMCDSASLV